MFIYPRASVWIDICDHVAVNKRINLINEGPCRALGSHYTIYPTKYHRRIILRKHVQIHAKYLKYA